MTATLAAVRTDCTSVAWTWGTTAAERTRPFPCDRWLPGADDALFRAVDVDAPARVVFRWLCQLRVAPYSYDWIDNFGRTSPRRLTPTESWSIARARIGARPGAARAMTGLWPRESSGIQQGAKSLDATYGQIK